MDIHNRTRLESTTRYSAAQAMLIVCTPNARKAAAAVHEFLSVRHANIKSETSTKHGSLFALNIFFESDPTTLLEIEATVEAALAPVMGDLADRAKPQLIPVPVEGCSYTGGFLGVVDCYVRDEVGLATRLANLVRENADIYQMVCYTTEAPMEGWPLFVAHIKIHVPTEECKARLEKAVETLSGKNSWDISATFRSLEVSAMPESRLAKKAGGRIRTKKTGGGKSAPAVDVKKQQRVA